jgi:uncharacterized protein YbbK (DUF523 family)/uncharacterized protein YbgA (DUF1722 family)
MPPQPPSAHPRLRLGISSCLLGQRVRYDGGDKRAALLAEVVGSRVEWVPVCPEVEVGLGTPRPPMVLRRGAGGPRLWTPSTGTDGTVAMRRFVRERVAALAAAGLSGYVLKSRSPSCGLRSVPLLDEKGERVATGSGLFAAALGRQLPRLPLAEEVELEEPAALAQFLRRAFFYRRWHARVEPLATFHRRHRALLLASGAAATRRLDRLLAAGDDSPELADHYESAALRILCRVPSRRCHARNFGWVVGHLVAAVDDRQRRTNVEAYRAFGRGELAWAAAANVLRRSAEAVGSEPVLANAYLFPEPAEWELLVRLDRLQPLQCAAVN